MPLFMEVLNISYGLGARSNFSMLFFPGKYAETSRFSVYLKLGTVVQELRSLGKIL